MDIPAGTPVTPFNEITGRRTSDPMNRQIKDTAVLVGTSPDGKCVYSASIELGDYWDGKHPWDSGAQVIALRLAKLQGFLFGGDGQLLQQFESCFNVQNGRLVSSWAIHEDGTRTTGPPGI